MSNGWRIWFALLIIAALYGLVMLADAGEVAVINDAGASTVTQQTVAGIWQVADVAAIIVYELIIAVVTIASLGLLLISRDDPPAEREEVSSRGAHRREKPPGS
ncbi:MAG TPA: hypothetical protein VF083_02885 [Acidimicrobiia bacterium]